MTGWQDVLVGVMALAAAFLVFRRVFGQTRPNQKTPGCANCPNGEGACQPSPALGRRSDEHPLTFVRPSQR